MKNMEIFFASTATIAFRSGTAGIEQVAGIEGKCQRMVLLLDWSVN